MRRTSSPRIHPRLLLGDGRYRPSAYPTLFCHSGLTLRFFTGRSAKLTVPASSCDVALLRWRQFSDLQQEHVGERLTKAGRVSVGGRRQGIVFFLSPVEPRSQSGVVKQRGPIERCPGLPRDFSDTSCVLVWTTIRLNTVIRLERVPKAGGILAEVL